MKEFLEKNQKLLVILILFFMLVVSTLNAWWDSAIFDETAHIPAGYSYLAEHDMRLNPEHPPLIKDLAGLPLLFLRLNFDTSQDFWTKDINGQWDAGKSLLYHSGNDADKIIFWSRMPIVILSLIFGWFIFRWAKEMAGALAGLFALTIYAFDPNILGHNHFVTTDLGIAAFMAFSFYYFLRFIKEPSWKNVLIGGFFLGLVQLAKFSAVLIFPVFGLVLVLYPLVRINRDRAVPDWKFKLGKLGEYLGKGLIAFAFSLLVVGIVYYINIFDMPKEKLAETISFYFPADDPSANARITNKVLIAMNDNGLLRPLSEYFLGVAMVFKRVAGGNGAYFMGQVSGQAFRWYFPAVFLLKEPIPNLIFMFLALIISFSSMIRTFVRSFPGFIKNSVRNIAYYLRTNIATFSMFAFILLYTYISVTGNLNIGLRHLFPIFPFAFILTAKTIVRFYKKHESSRLLLSSTVLILSAFLVLETILVYPAYMSYFNELAGGPKNGYRFVTDSNADWGQDLKRLKVYLEKHPEIKNIRVDYFGGGDMRYYLKDKYLMWWDSKRPVEPGWYAISTNFLQGSLYDKTKKDEESYRWIRNISPYDQVGTSFFIYNITPQEAETAK